MSSLVTSPLMKYVHHKAATGPRTTGETLRRAHSSVQSFDNSIQLDTPSRWTALALLAIAELLCLSLWFSGSAVVPASSKEWQLTESQASWISIAVQLGFVAGTLISAVFNLSDIISSRHLFAVAGIVGALTNATFGLYAKQPTSAIALRFLTGVCLAGVYPPGMKIMATWFRQRRGMALGVLVGALTLGKATPYLVNGLGSANWRTNVLFVSALAVVGSLVVLSLCLRRALRLAASNVSISNKQLEFSAIEASDSQALGTSVTCGNSTACGFGFR